jgi:nucleotide-binding universal stress UspA family protein
MSHTILWPTELSKSSLKAVKHVMSLSEKYQANVVVLYVAPDLCSMFPAYGSYPSGEYIERFQDWELEKAREKLQKICSGELQGCPNLSLRLLRGDAAEMIVETAEKEGADMIVMASRGQTFDRSGAKWSDLGSVAKKVVKNAPVPVYLVNPETGESGA